MGYRRDADIPCPYGYVIKDPTKNVPSDEEWKHMLMVLVVHMKLQLQLCLEQNKTHRVVCK
jgi:hypothetical protein